MSANDFRGSPTGEPGEEQPADQLPEGETDKGESLMRRTVYVHGIAVSTDAPTMTARELKVAARIDPSRYLWVERGDGVPEDRKIEEDEAIALVDRMRFYSVPMGMF